MPNILGLATILPRIFGLVITQLGTPMLYLIYILSGIIVGAILYYTLRQKKQIAQPAASVQRALLQQHVAFYQQLGSSQQAQFLTRMRYFLQRVRITGVGTTVTDTDKVLVASAAIIPIFAFSNWLYPNISEVLLYPTTFGKGYNTTGQDRNLLGMVGNGPLQNMMLLSQPDLHYGFANTQDTSNTAIHEFVHLVDKADGYADGFPEALVQHQYSLPWLRRIHEEIKKIQEGQSDINPYGATNEAEFLAVAGEYFFTQPQQMQEQHPALYLLLQQAFAPTHP